jgi:hypothetical protein
LSDIGGSETADIRLCQKPNFEVISVYDFLDNLFNPLLFKINSFKDKNKSLSTILNRALGVL